MAPGIIVASVTCVVDGHVTRVVTVRRPGDFFTNYPVRRQDQWQGKCGMSLDPFDRRDFLRGAATTLALLMSDRGLSAAPRSDSDEPPPSGPPLKLAVVGLGLWGREILATVSRMPFVEVTGVCDTYAPFLKRGAESAAGARAVVDYRELLDSPEVEAIAVATPSHLHRDIAVAALEAGKHLYCEAPLATTVDDARDIAVAARRAGGRVFQGGLQSRSNDLHEHVRRFKRSRVLGDPVLVLGHWNRKESWRRAAPTPEREKELNWRLSRGTSAGLLGEEGVHQLDLISRFLGSLPEALTGFGTIAAWKDGRDVPDTVQCVFEYPNGVRVVYTATLASSCGGAYTLFQGTNSSLMLRERRSWLIKEADSPLLGWEVYARKEPVHDETGIALVADATKLLDDGKDPSQEGSVEPTKEPLFLAFENFVRRIRDGAPPVCGPEESFQASAVAIVANDAVLAGSRLAYPAGLLELSA
jgi:predicted dehydrogenase